MAATKKKAAPNTEKQNQKHDESYKSVLSNAANFLHFLKKYIAMPWVANISVGDLEKINNSFVTEEYIEIDSDLIYKLKIGGSDVYFYVLVELQSQVDFTMPFRLLKYMVELLDYIFKHTKKKDRRRKDFRLPAIVPIVLYNGNNNWTAVRSYREYTKNYESFGDNIIDFRYLLFDVKRTDEATILSTKKILDAVLLLDKRRLEHKTSTEEVAAFLEDYLPNLPKDDAIELLGWVTYAHYKGDMSPETKEKFKNLLKGGGNTMKHALEICRDELIDEAKREEALKIAKYFKDKGIPVENIAEATGLTIDEIIQL